MGHYITSVTAIRDAVDQLSWEAKVATPDIARERAFIVHWEGHVAFSREPVPRNHGSASPGARPTLQARWTNREDSSRILAPGELTFKFITDLPGDALARIDAFRENGRIFARLEGKLVVINPRSGVQNPAMPPWLDDITDIMSRGNRPWVDNVFSEPYDLREAWCTKILPTLRPPGRVLLELRVALAHPHDETAKRLVALLNEAQGAFDIGGRDGEVGRICYRAIDELRKLVDLAEPRYGQYARDRLGDQIKALGSICNPERHGDRPEHDGLVFDHAMALHVLTATMAVAGVLLQ